MGRRAPDRASVMADLEAELERLLVERERIRVRRRVIAAALVRIDEEREAARIDHLLGLS